MDKNGLADFLRGRRHLLRPGDVGLAERSCYRPRRTPGLRREEVAELAGVSANYYERLEQARAPGPSPQVIASLGRALLLSEAERGHLSRLAGHTPPVRPERSGHVPPGVLALLDRLGPVAAYVCDSGHDILAWNPLAAALIADFAELPPAERNVLRLALRLGGAGCSAPPDASGGLAGFAAQAAAQSREAVTRRPSDTGLRQLVEEYAEHDADFAAGWAQHDVRTRPTLRKRFDHGELGVFDLDCQTLDIPGGELRLVLLSADPGSLAYDKLTRLQLRTPAAAPQRPA